ncbi:MAG: hypothetical protein HGA85_01655 [Nanoarchaeota archaeon]|nr:hypothetical protein [Nanoarchaeota archaeon]
MRFAVIVSKKDEAGQNIKQHIACPENAFLVEIEKDTIYFDEADLLQADILIFATRHQSESKEKTLSLHFPGNFSDPKFGGTKAKFPKAPASFAKQMFANLAEAGEGTEYKVTMEATHHGPTLAKPCIFIEIGSAPDQWRDGSAGKKIAGVIRKTILELQPRKHEVALGFGGTHYCAGFNKIELSENVAMGHICPKYNVSVLTKEIIHEMMASTVEHVDYALLDWKGLTSADRQHITGILSEIGLPWKKL